MHIASVLLARDSSRSAGESDELQPQAIESTRQSLPRYKLLLWCVGVLTLSASVWCVGVFESTRLTTYVLRSPCTILDSEIGDVGTCTVCDGEEVPTCESYPIATARISVTFKPLHEKKNVTGFVWYCKVRATEDPCDVSNKGMDQLGLDKREAAAYAFDNSPGLAAPFACSLGEIFAHVQQQKARASALDCYYSSRDPASQEVWLSMPAPGVVDHQWFKKHMEYPLALAIGGLVLLATLLTCLAVEGVELWAAGVLT